MRRTLNLALLLLLLAVPLTAYTLYLRDGSTILVRREPRIEAGRAYFTLQSGTESFLAVEEIDLDKTRTANSESWDGALVVRDGSVTDISTPEESTEPETLGDLIDSGVAGPRMRPTAKRADAPPPKRGLQAPTPPPRKTPASARKEHTDLVLVGEIQKTFEAQGLDDVAVYKTASAGRPLVEIGANSEAAVFRALETSASLLLQLQDSFPGQMTELELILTTSRGENGGRFILDPQSAIELTEKQVNVSAFYVERVLF